MIDFWTILIAPAAVVVSMLTDSQGDFWERYYRRREEKKRLARSLGVRDTTEIQGSESPEK